MPYLRIETNLTRNQIPDGFVRETVDVLARAIGKPKNYCCVAVIPDVNMCFGGSDGSCAQASLMSIGNLGKEENQRISSVLFKHIKKTLGIESDKMYIAYTDSHPAFVGFQETTFHHIFGYP